MKRLFASALAAVLLGSIGLPMESRAADLAKPVRHRYARARPSVDAVELATLAPLSSRSTAEQTYGDAAIARSRVQGHIARETTGAAAPYPCDPRDAIAAGYVCENVPGRLGYGQYYAFTPAALTAPQISEGDPRAQTPLVTAPTALLLDVNSLLFGSHQP